MTSQLNSQLAPVLIGDQLQSAQDHRAGRVHTYSTPIVREIPQPVGPDQLHTSIW